LREIKWLVKEHGIRSIITIKEKVLVLQTRCFFKVSQ
jgi:hypothetical protein